MQRTHFAILTTVSLLAASTIAIAGQPVRHAPHRIVHANPGISVSMDEARIVTFSRPISTIFIGNTTIADATIIDSRHAYVLGKTFGITNVIGLDADHQQILNSQVYVTNRTMGAVTVNRGAETYNYSCTSMHCETNPRPGDPSTYFSQTESAYQSHEDYSAKAGSAPSGVASNQ